jgi:hypothetical protein
MNQIAAPGFGSLPETLQQYLTGLGMRRGEFRLMVFRVCPRIRAKSVPPIAVKRRSISNACRERTYAFRNGDQSVTHLEPGDATLEDVKLYSGRLEIARLMNFRYDLRR